MSDNTYTTDEITEACNVDIRLLPVLIYRSVKTGDWNDLSTWEQAIVENPDESNGDHWADATSYPGEVKNEDGIGDPLVEVRDEHTVTIEYYEIVFNHVKITGDGKIVVNQSNNGKLTIDEQLEMDESTSISIE